MNRRPEIYERIHRSLIKMDGFSLHIFFLKLKDHDSRNAVYIKQGIHAGNMTSLLDGPGMKIKCQEEHGHD